MRLGLSIYVIIGIFFLSCQPTRGKGNATTSCTDTNKNGICDDKDSDDDGLLDEKEKELGSDPNITDTDGDGASDLCEYNKGTNLQDPVSKPANCDNGTTQSPTTGDDNLDLMCELYANQLEQNDFLFDNFKVTTECKEIDVKDESGNVVDKRKVCKTDYSTGGNYIGAKNYGDPEAAEKATLTIKVKWGVSYKDVLSISNGILTIRPWYKYWTRIEEEDDGYFEDDNNTWDHHLGDLPSLSDYCENDIKGFAAIEVNGTPYTWFQPAFLPFKISEYANLYPFSTDAVQLANDQDKDGIEYFGGGYNNFSYQTHLISVSVEDQAYDESKAFKPKLQRGKNIVGAIAVAAGVYVGYKYGPQLLPAVNSSEVASDDKEANSACKVREVTFKYEFFKEKPEDGMLPNELDFKELQEKCEDFLTN